MPRRQGACRTTCRAAAGCRSGSASALGCRVDQRPRRGDRRTGAAPTRSAELAFYLIPRTRLLLYTAAIPFRHATLRDARAHSGALGVGWLAPHGQAVSHLEQDRSQILFSPTAVAVCPHHCALRRTLARSWSCESQCERRRALPCQVVALPLAAIRAAPRCVDRSASVHSRQDAACAWQLQRARCAHVGLSRRSCDLQLNPCCPIQMPAKRCHAAMPVVKCDMPRLGPPASHDGRGL